MIHMNVSNLITNIFFIIITLFTIGLSISFWMLAIKVLGKLDKFLDLKILESEVELDKDKF